MKKNEQQMHEEYEWGMQYLMYIYGFMESFDNEDAECKNYTELAQSYAEPKSTYEGGIEHYWQTITDLKIMAEKEMDSWETITDQANTWMPDAAATKKWLENDVIPVLLVEAERRGWKKPS